MRQGSMRSDARVSGEYATKGLVGERIGRYRGRRWPSCDAAPWVRVRVRVRARVRIRVRVQPLPLSNPYPCPY